MGKTVDMPASGPRVLGVGVDEAIGVAAQDALRQAGLRATVITVTDDAAGDERLRAALRVGTYDAVNIGAGLTGQAPPQYGATATSTVWFNRLLNIARRRTDSKDRPRAVQLTSCRPSNVSSPPAEARP